MDRVKFRVLRRAWQKNIWKNWWRNEIGSYDIFCRKKWYCTGNLYGKADTDTTWEICKLSSNKNLPHKGAGSAVFEAAMKRALNHGAQRLFILSNSKLKPALHIYRKYGFKEIKLEDYEYIRGDIAFEHNKTYYIDISILP